MLSKEWLAKHPCPKPWEHMAGVEAWCEDAFLEVLPKVGDEPIFIRELIAAMTPHIPRRRRKWLYDADNDAKAIDGFLSGGLTNAMKCFGDWKDQDARSSYLRIPKHGAYATAYYRRRSAVALHEYDVCIEHERKKKRTAQRNIDVLQTLREEAAAVVGAAA